MLSRIGQHLTNDFEAHMENLEDLEKLSSFFLVTVDAANKGNPHKDSDQSRTAAKAVECLPRVWSFVVSASVGRARQDLGVILRQAR